MADQMTQGSGVAGDIDAALSTLDIALNDARRAVDVIRGSLSQIAGLERRFREMETAVSRALESLSAPLEPGAPPATVAQLRPVSGEAGDQAFAAVEQEQAPARVSHCLRLTVQSKSGSLDLKAVDTAVNDNRDVVDVALLDYDGREATLKLWVNPEVDPEHVRQALIESLQSQLGEDGTAEAYIDFEEAA